ncbi:MAG: hypothetical protein LC799_28905 [Actinobacteria bacterium]|nr:hypothetical protein [Actinomycetota bacterium]
MAASAALTRSLVVWVTSGADGTEHAVIAEQMAAARTGVYAARCGVRVVAAALVAPALRRCTDCVALLSPQPGRHRAKRIRNRHG